MIVLDTHALVWWLQGAKRFSPAAKRAVEGARRQGPLIVSAITLFELATLVRRGRLALEVPGEQWISALPALPQLRFEPVSAELARLAGSLNEEMPGDPADRIIAATAMSLGMKLITADERLRGVQRLQTVW